MRWTSICLSLALGIVSGAAVAADQFQRTAADAGAPNLYASAGNRKDGGSAGTRVVPIQLSNTGTGPAEEARVDSIRAKVLSGAGEVTVITSLPLQFGTIQPSRTAVEDVIFNWPPGATRVRIDVHYSAAGGEYQYDTSLSLLR